MKIFFFLGLLIIAAVTQNIPDCATDVEQEETLYYDFTTITLRSSLPGYISVVEFNQSITKLAIEVHGTQESISKVQIVHGTDANNQTLVTVGIKSDASSSTEETTSLWSTLTSLITSTSWWSTSEPQSSSTTRMSSIHEESSLESSTLGSTNTDTTPEQSSGSYKKSSRFLMATGLLAASSKMPMPTALLALGVMLGSEVVCQNASECLYITMTLYLPKGIAAFVPNELNMVYESTNLTGDLVYRFGQSKAETYSLCTNAGIGGECIPATQCTGRRTPATGLCRGPASIQCCSDNWGTCTVNNTVLGVCRDVNNCNGHTTSGRCPGPAGVRCCTPTNATTTEPLTFGAPMAEPTGIYWPLMQNKTARSPVCYLSETGVPIQVPPLPMAENYPCRTRRFLAMRDDGERYHSGIDLYATAGTPVIAAESGVIVDAYLFYENVCCVIQQTDSGHVINYGEISCDYVVQKNQRVEAGQLIGHVGVLECCHPMMHFEIYRNGTTSNIRSFINK